MGKHNDTDWFKLTIWGYTGGNLTVDSVEFYLADYRFPNNSQDYIIKDWNWVDLISLGAIDSLTFVLSSSDVGSFGMNTPAFFAIDNFNDQNVSVEEQTLAVDFNVYPNPAIDLMYINLTNPINKLEIIDLRGKTILTENDLAAGIHTLKISELSTGIYLVTTTTAELTLVKRLIKN